MFTNPYREKCVNILEKLLPRRAVQDSTLLQAYATFHDAGVKSIGNF